MNGDELKRATKHLGGLFSGQVTQELAILIKKDWQRFEFKLTLEAIGSHKSAMTSDKGFLNYGKLLSEIRSMHKPRELAPTTNSANEGTWCDVRRRQGEHLRGAGDFEVILRVHRDWWRRCSKDDHWRAKLSNGARRLLIQCGMTDDIAAEWADTIFIEEVEAFRSLLLQLRGDAGVFDNAAAASAGV